MFGWEFPPYMSGGLGTACLGITRALMNQQVKVLFVMPGKKKLHDDRMIRFISPEGIIEDSYPDVGGSAKTGMSRYLVESSLHPYLKAGAYEGQRIAGTSILAGLGADGIAEFVPYGSDLFVEVGRYARSAEAIARAESFDVIHSHDWMTVHAALKAKEISGKPWIFHVHSLEQDRSGEAANASIIEVERRGMIESDHIVAVSNYTKRCIVTYYGIPTDKVSVVHNGIFLGDNPDATDAMRGDEKKAKNILFLGRITFQKGPEYFVEAAAEVLKRLPEVKFIMAGSGDMMPGMIEKVAELGIGQHFHFAGFLRGDDVEKVFRMSDLYVMPSVSEPFGISPLEATRFGVPVIMSRQSGVAEILHHCLLVDFWNVRDLSDKMIALLCREPLATELRIRSREELPRADWNEAAQKIKAVYTQVMH
ncbi:MAG: glycosyltransferase family 4 protein [Syntrophaceae bacterium]|nr:glycosyltransferase family 4 protein [Syntrophaceae bacterium]